MTPFGERMRKLRSERGVTLKQMAEALGVSPRGAQGFFRAVQAHALVAGRG